MSGTRSATHAGSWYTSNGECSAPGIKPQPNVATHPPLGNALRAELDANLRRVHALPELDYAPPISDAKAVIAPCVLILVVRIVVLGLIACSTDTPDTRTLAQQPLGRTQR